MSQIKNEAIRLIQSLSDDCTWEEIQYHLYVRDKVLRGLAAADRGEVRSQAEMKEWVKRWPASSGPTPRATT